MMNVTIDGKAVQVEEPISILEAAKQQGIKIPTLCYNEHFSAWGGCRLCVVEVAAARAPDRFRLLPACSTPVEDGQVIKTDTERVAEGRKFVVELLLSRCPGSEEIQELAAGFGVTRDGGDLDVVGRYLLQRATPPEETNCILCGQCVRVCQEVTERNALAFTKRGIKRKVRSPFGKIAETCIGCGSCAYVCPTNTITIEEAG